MAENRYKRHVAQRLEREFPGCMIIKLDAGSQQGIPDRLVLYGNRWAALEVKDSEDAPTQPNQPYFVNRMNEMSFAAFIYPENEEAVFYELHLAFAEPRRYARLSEPE